MTTRRVLLACDIDSQVFGALPLALAFAARGWSVTFAIESVRTLPQQLLERLTRDFSIVERSIGALPTEDMIFDHDAVGVFVTGSRLAMFRHVLDLSSKVKKRPRPAQFCNFNGLVFEKFEEGLAWRLGYDVIGLNGPRDRDAFVDFLHATEFSRQPSVIVGLRRKTDTPPKPLKLPPAPPPEEPALEEAKAAVDPEDATAEPNAVTSTEPASDTTDAAEAPVAAELAPEVDPAVAATAEAGAEDVVSEPASEDGASAEAAPTDSDVGATSNAPNADETAVPEPLEAPTAPEDAAVPQPAPAALPKPPRKLFVFAEQVVVPRSLRERQNLVATLARLAQSSPGWDVVIKARTRPDEQTFHQQANHISKLVKDVRRKPRNLIVSYESLDALLDRADLFATVSSTALFDAFDYGVPSMVATDFGLRNADGAHVFFASGLLVRLGDLPSLDAAPIRSPDERWVRRMGYGAPFSPDALIDWLETFNPDRPMPAAFVSFQAAANVASGNSGQAGRIYDVWKKIEASLSREAEAVPVVETAEDGAEPSTAAADAVERRAGLFKLGSLISEALSPSGSDRNAKTASPRDSKESPPPSAAANAPAPRKTSTPAPARSKDGPIAAMSRKLGMYWFYKRVRKNLGVPVK